jgi:hypothetical protein
MVSAGQDKVSKVRSKYKFMIVGIDISASVFRQKSYNKPNKYSHESPYTIATHFDANISSMQRTAWNQPQNANKKYAHFSGVHVFA